jgi:hypothetical protein
LGSSERGKEINKIYGWNLILKGLCNNVGDLEKVLNEDFINVLTWLELSKAEEELTNIYMEEQKKNNKTR